ncbi:helix-turn-helix domain-containing protein [Actinokineospora iranica]|uniref:DNA-binding transcriptional regulator, XRE-family HTH domain n=1 Tax=Actinokineospora iranica TaxID=1271860 RepID=A0A1G6J090_9PSEU|nr:DNA-binding transcriptional regulator, XRE-family HTH domain [Actinokineospora iranica]
MAYAPERSVGALLRQWREHRRLSQLDLSLQAEVSTRHLSFVETGRSAPSREMVLHLSDILGLPLRERNQMLLAAGYAPVYSRTALDSPRMTAVRTAVRQVLTGHEPYPAVAVDRGWHLVDANDSLRALLQGVAPGLLAPPANVLRISLHPDGLAPRIVNLGEWRAHLLARLRGQITLTADEKLAALHDELSAYPCAQPEPEIDQHAADVVVPLRLRTRDAELAFFGTVTTFGTPLDITVAELAIESFFPADQATAEALRGR